MTKFRIFLIIVLLCLSLPLQGAQYFLKLSASGQVRRPTLLKQGLLGKKSVAQFLPAVSLKNAPSFLNQWLKLTVADSLARQILQQLKTDGLVEAVEPVGVFKIHDFPNDSLAGSQWYLQTLRIPEVWQTTRGDASIVVAIIDTGIDYHHPDLQGVFWINQPEKDGQAGVDDDGNGLIDDVIGWDFTDAPRFPDGGDYLTPDPDPMDEYSGGHGTEVAGIIAARANNQTGIAGIAPKVKIMNLRAGTASGYLEEDDVINALLYALNEGARVVNMSFGDVKASTLFHDVVHYLWQNGMVLVAAAGNEAVNNVYLPAGFAEVIAVGSSDVEDRLAAFSNFGSALDLLAPGVEILSTAPQNRYRTVNGTSFSAPMVSAVSALLLSRFSDYTNEQVRTVLKGTAVDLPPTGIDIYSGAGRLDALKAVRMPNRGELRFVEPLPMSSTARDVLPVLATAFHPDFQSLSLSFGIGENPETWTVLKTWQSRFFFNDTLTQMNLQTLPDTVLSLRLQMRLLMGEVFQEMRTVRIDRTPPQLRSLQLVPALNGLEQIFLLSVTADEAVKLTVRVLQSRSSDVLLNIQHTDYFKNQFLILTPEHLQSGDVLEVILTNRSGLQTTAQQIIPMGNVFPQVALQPWQVTAGNLPAGFLYPTTFDLNGNGQPEVLLSRYTSFHAFGPLEWYEFQNGEFFFKQRSQLPWIPRGVRDVDGDGVLEILANYGQNSVLFKKSSDGQLFSQKMWADTSFWAATLADWDQDGLGEIIGYSDSGYQVLEWDGSAFNKVLELPNLSAGENRLGVPKVAIGDLNGDGQNELVFGDYDGDLLLFSVDGKLWKTLRAKLSDATELFTILSQEQTLFVLSHSPDELAFESEQEQRYWTLQAFTYNAQIDEFESQTVATFYPYFSKNRFDHGLQAVYQQGSAGLFVTLYPQLYYFTRSTDGSWQLSWNESSCNSNTVVVDDFDADGSVDALFNNGHKIVRYSSTPQERPPAPYACQAQPLDSTRVVVSWKGEGKNGFLLFKGTEKSNLQPLGLLTTNAFVDTGLVQDQTYFYAVCALDSSLNNVKSYFSNIDSAVTGTPPALISVKVQFPRQLHVLFDRPVRLTQSSKITLYLKSDSSTARSLVEVQSKRGILAIFEQDFPAGDCGQVVVQNIRGQNDVPVDQRYRSLRVCFADSGQAPRLIGFKILNRQQIVLNFNQPMDSASVLNVNNYQLEPSGRVIQVTAGTNDLQTVTLVLDERSPAGGFGKPTYLHLLEIYGENGQRLQQPLKLNLYRPVDDLNQITVYPQPVRPQDRELIFAKLPPNAQIQIFTMNGKRVRSFTQVNAEGGVIWDLRDASGALVAPGVYFYRIVNRRQEKIGKLVIVR